MSRKVEIRFEDSDYEKIQEKSKKFLLKPSQYIRFLVSKGLNQRN